MDKLMVMFLTLAMLTVCGPVFAGRKSSNTDIRVSSIEQMGSATSTSDISATNLWSVAANTSKYTDSFDLSDEDLGSLGIFVSFSAVNSGTHILYLQGSNDDTNFANIAIASQSLTASTTAANPLVTKDIRTKVSVSAISDNAVAITNVPRFYRYRWHLDADASNGPAVVDVFNMCHH